MKALSFIVSFDVSLLPNAFLSCLVAKDASASFVLVIVHARLQFPSSRWRLMLTKKALQPNAAKLRIPANSMSHVLASANHLLTRGLICWHLFADVSPSYGVGRLEA